MKMVNRGMVMLIGICCVLMSTSKAIAQTGTTEGKEFYFGFLINGSSDNPYNLSVHVSAKEATSATLSIPGADFSFPFTLSANESRSFPIPDQYKPNVVGEKQALAIRITATKDVSVFAYNEVSNTSDATMVLPIQSLGDEYILHAYNNDFFQQSATQNQVLLVGTRDTTIYEFVPSVDILELDETVIHAAGEVVRDTLFFGEQIAYHAVENMSGSVVRTINDNPEVDCVPIAVFIGHVATQVDVCVSPDHLFNQLYAPADWGFEYLVVPFATRFGGDVVQVMAELNNTRIEIGHNTVVTLDRGERHTFLAPVATQIKANKRISVMQLSRGKRCDNNERGDDLADPFMIMLSPANQIINEITFPVFSNESIEKLFVSMVVPSNDIEVFLDGIDISDQFIVSTQNPDYAYATSTIRTGSRTLSSKHGVVGHLYGFGDSESYGVAIGANLGEFDVEIIDEQQGLLAGERVSVCEDALLDFNVTSDNPILRDTYTDFKWILSNGVILDGDQVTFEFDSAGVYTLDMVASKSVSKCSQLIVTREIDVVENALDGIIGPASVCPNAQDITYAVDGFDATYTYNWLVEGGAFDGQSSGTSVQVDWSIADPGAKVSVYSISPIGCVSDTVDFDIVLNEVLEPAAPLGPAQLCADNTQNVRYSTSKATGSSYLWEAVGGDIVAGQGTERVEVTWSGPGEHVLRFYESTVVNNLCGGSSKDLQITVYEPLNSSYIAESTSCFGDSDGSATLELTGGLAPYEVFWETGAQGLTLAGQASGTYQATIRDALGCELIVEVDIGQPEVLSAAVISQDAVCNGERGNARVQVTGGTEPFLFNWADGPSTSNTLRDGLGIGNYTVLVVDSNGCTSEVSFGIKEPSALEAEISSKPACPEAADGILSVAVDGGQGPYTYLWEADASVTGNIIDGLTEGAYTVTVVDAAGCELELRTNVENLSPLITLPTAFTPNGDGVNDSFGIVYNCVVTTKIAVYNKWGQLMFTSTNIDEQWDGTYQGGEAPAGSYTYSLNYQTIFNGSALNKVLTGRVQLLR